MSLHSRILTEHNNWRTEKGYEEDLLDAVEPVGTFAVALQERLLQALIDTFLSDKPDTFSLFLTGYFNDRRDKVLFEFCYSYDPNDTRLYLEKLVAKLDGEQLEFPIWKNSRKDLPPAIKVYQKLFALVKASALARTLPAPTGAPAIKR